MVYYGKNRIILRLNKNMYKRETEEKLQSELTEFQNRNVVLSLNGSESSPQDIAKACAVAENGTYMRDYIEDDGEIRQVDFIYVEETR